MVEKPLPNLVQKSTQLFQTKKESESLEILRQKTK